MAKKSRQVPAEEPKQVQAEESKHDPVSVTTRVMEQIIDGSPVKILYDYPLSDGRVEDGEWYIKQPTDWQYDMALAVQDVAYTRFENTPEVRDGATLPPSNRWMRRRKRREEAINADIADLEARGDKLTPEEALSLEDLRQSKVLLADPETMTLLKEKAGEISGKARDYYLLKHLTVDASGTLIFDQNTDDGRRRWDAFPTATKENLRIIVWRVLGYISTAKN